MKKKPIPQSIPYDPASIEKKWQKKWGSKKIYKSTEGNKEKGKGKMKEKFYVLDMFPYPSGEGLHVGHPKGYIATDVVSRFHRMNGKSVLHPMGFDAFGLPAENYAIKMKVNPAIGVKKNIARFKKQLEILGFDYDWSREVNTTDPAYYRWTQWIFLQMYKKGLAYESFEPINWCPSCKTGLANEDLENGRCERCGTPVEKKPLRQWVLKITEYAERLLADLDATDSTGKLLLDWPVSIKESQKNWIGKSEGAEIQFKIQSEKLKINKHITVFTTRADTLFGVTYVVLAPEHASVQELLDSVSNRNEVEAYIAQAKLETEIERTDAKKEKTGVELKGVKAINPVNGEEVSVWISDYVLADYGTGAVMAVPAHDDRDMAFAKKYGLPIKEVVAEETGTIVVDEERRDGVATVIFDPHTQKYAVLKWKINGLYGLLSGGRDSNESDRETLEREVAEESGFNDFTRIEELGHIFAHYYNGLKRIPRSALAAGYLIVLNSTRADETRREEHEKFDIAWVSAHEIVENWKQHESIGLGHWKLFLERGIARAIELGYDKTTDSRMFSWKSTTGDGMLINSGAFSGINSSEARNKIAQTFGTLKTTYKLRDWVFSRQRYWGEPMPLIHCEKCGVVPVPEKDLPVKLPPVTSYEPTGTGESPLAAISKWVNVKCPVCKGKAKRETNTMPQWAGSSWYYLRYMDPKNKKVLVDSQKEKYWAPVDLYVGGAEHATRHLIYARFWHKFLYDIGVVSTTEPFKKLQNVGLIMGEDGRKMSKRFGNVINPDDIVATYGADTLRLYEMFMGPFDQQISWSTSSMVGPRRFIERVWKLREKISGETTENNVSPITKILHKTIQKVSSDITSLQFNTAVSSLMIAVNEIEKQPSITTQEFEILLKLLAPFTPHVTEELWSSLGNKTSIHTSPWPVYDPTCAVDTEMNIVVQINGKVRGSFTIDAGMSETQVTDMAQSLPETKKWLEGKRVVKVIYVPKRLVNIVIA